jgi:hypothetical protein
VGAESVDKSLDIRSKSLSQSVMISSKKFFGKSVPQIEGDVGNFIVRLVAAGQHGVENGQGKMIARV